MRINSCSLVIQLDPPRPVPRAGPPSGTQAPERRQRACDHRGDERAVLLGVAELVDLPTEADRFRPCRGSTLRNRFLISPWQVLWGLLHLGEVIIFFTFVAEQEFGSHQPGAHSAQHGGAL